MTTVRLDKTALTSSVEILKHPIEVLQLAMDFSVWLPNADILTCSTSVNACGTYSGCMPNDVVISNVTIVGKTVHFTVSGGLANVNYVVSVTVTTSNDEIRVGNGVLKVRNG